LNQPDSLGFLFHLIDVVVGNGFAAEKKLNFTIFAHRKCYLWKSCGLSFEITHRGERRDRRDSFEFLVLTRLRRVKF
jgi:hypothetical protein